MICRKCCFSCRNKIRQSYKSLLLIEILHSKEIGMIIKRMKVKFNSFGDLYWAISEINFEKWPRARFRNSYSDLLIVLLLNFSIVVPKYDIVPHSLLQS